MMNRGWDTDNVRDRLSITSTCKFTCIICRCRSRSASPHVGRAISGWGGTMSTMVSCRVCGGEEFEEDELGDEICTRCNTKCQVCCCHSWCAWPSRSVMLSRLPRTRCAQQEARAETYDVRGCVPRARAAPFWPRPRRTAKLWQPNTAVHATRHATRALAR